MRHNSRAVPFAFGVWLAAAVVQSAVLGDDPLYWLFVAAVAGCAMVLRARVPLFVMGAILGASVAGIRAMPITHGPLHDAAQERSRVELIARVLGDPIAINRRNALDWSDEGTMLVRISAQGMPLDMFTKDVDVQWGQVVRVVGRLAPARAGRASAATVNASSVTVLRSAPLYLRWAEPARKAMHRALSNTPHESRALIPGLALGDTSALPAELASDMRASGLSHLTAVSGANVALIVAGAGLLARRRRYRVVLVSLAVVSFVVLVRPQPSVLRAAVMAGISTAAFVFHRRTAVLPALCGAVVLLVVVDPFLATSYGFALSVAATAGLLLVPCEPRTIVGQAVVATLAAQLAVLPLTVALGSPVTLASIPANLVAVPMAAPAMISGLCVGVIALGWPWLGSVVAWVSVGPAWVIAHTAHVAADADFAILPWPHGPAGVLSALGLTLLVGWHAARWHDSDVVMRAWGLSSILLFTAVVVSPPRPFETAWPPAGWRMVACDVGQGDATVLRVESHSAIVIDVGGEPSAIDGCLKSLHIRQVPLLVLTHFHADHVGGLEGVLHRRNVGQVLVSPLDDPPVMKEFVVQVLGARGITPQAMSFPGQIVVDGITLRCVWPVRLLHGPGSAANNASVVLRTTIDGITFLLTGDVEPPAQEALLPSVGPVDVLKVAHHGSRYQSPRFAARVHPRIATISVGANNDYGHPAAATIAMYEAMGTTILRTDQVGDIAVVRRNGLLVAVGRHT